MIPVPTWPAAHLAFDVLAWGGALTLGYGLYRWRLREPTLRLAGAVGGGFFVGLTAGAVIGAWLAGSLNTLNTASPQLSHSVLGALAGAIVGVEIYKAVNGVQGAVGSIFVGPFALGVVIGRWGCLFTGLPDRTFGTPTSLSWAVDLGDGIGRHPVQIYESAAMAVFLAFYLIGLWRRAAWTDGRAFHVLCVVYGTQRFAWEFLKPYPAMIGPFNIFHLICAALILYGCIDRRGDLVEGRANWGVAVTERGR